ncbi:hypothetical protein P7C70_g7120, partial [Phenoliferia sp. Uapishka_3]
MSTISSLLSAPVPTPDSKSTPKDSSPQIKSTVQPVSSTPSSPTTESPPSTREPYKVLDEPYGAGRPIKVITIGAGASGLNLQHEIDEKFGREGMVTHVVYEKNEAVGGTWFENRYPGCQCDIPSVNYQLTWAPSAEWSSYYSTATEILDYFKKVTSDYKLDRNVHLNHTLTGAWWMEDEKKWKVKLMRNNDPEDIVEDTGDVLVNATGSVSTSKWVWPTIAGRETFKGPMLHSANWDDSIDLTNKRIGLIGSGSSGIQILPAILDSKLSHYTLMITLFLNRRAKFSAEVAHVTTFVRSKTWITAGFAQRFAGENGVNFKYNATQREIFRNDPEKYLMYRKNIESELNSRFRFILNGSAEQAEAKAFAAKEMARKLEKRPWLSDVIIPQDFAVGCRRPTPGNGYLEALCDDKVTVVPGAISSINETGITDANGVHHECDVIICATGFDVTWQPKYPLVGREGRDLRDEWKDGPENYLSCTIPKFPNHFTIMGPFAPYGHGSVLPMTEHFARHVVQMMEKMVIERVVTWEPKQSAVDDWTEHRRAFLPRTAWSGNCSSWFKQGIRVEGDVMMWPGSRLHFFEVMNKVRWEDYELTTTSANRFEYMANGFAQREFDGRDLSWYIGLLEGGKDAQPDYSDEAIGAFLKH